MNPLAGVLNEAWDMYRAHAKHLISIAAVVYVVAAVVELVLGFLGPIGALLAVIVSLIAAFLLQAALVKAVEDVRDGRADLSFSETLEAARPAVGSVALASILASLGIAVGLVLVIIPGLILLTLWCLIVPVIVLEHVGVGAAFGRSRALVRGFGWQVFGTLVLVFLLLLAVSIVLGFIFAPFPVEVRNFLSSIVSGSLVSPYLSLVLTLGYFRLRSAHGDGDAGAGPAYGQSPYGAPPTA